jgi:hypothetical protein
MNAGTETNLATVPFDDSGRVSRMGHYTDTARHVAAFRGEDTTANASSA